MQERHVKVPTPDGAMRTFIAAPDGKGPFRAVIMYFYGGGLSDPMRVLARRVAAEGYYCAMPDLYYRAGEIVFDPDSNDPIGNEIKKLMGQAVRNNTQVLADTKALLDYFDTQPDVEKGEVGCIGYCRGGRFAVAAAGEFPDRFAAVASIFPLQLITDLPDSAHTYVPKIRGDIYFGVPEHDKSFPDAERAEFFALMERERKDHYQYETHPGTHHGYTFPDRKVYDEKASELTWKRIFDLFARKLPMKAAAAR